MNDVGIFIVGAVLFVMTTWATLAFGMGRVQEIHHRDLEASDAVTNIKEGKYTEVHMTTPPDTES